MKPTPLKILFEPVLMFSTSGAIKGSGAVVPGTKLPEAQVNVTARAGVADSVSVIRVTAAAARCDLRNRVIGFSGKGVSAETATERTGGQ